MSKFEYAPPIKIVNENTTNLQEQPDTADESSQQLPPPQMTILPPQVIIQLPPPSSKEIRIKEPTPFTGDQRKLNNFLLEVEMEFKIKFS